MGGLLLAGAAGIGDILIENGLVDRNKEPGWEYVKASLHNHTNFSGSEYLKDDTLDKMIPEAFDRGIGILAVTDHDQDNAFSEVLSNKNLLPRTYKIHKIDNRLLLIEKEDTLLYFIRGIEYHDNKSGHLVAWGYDRQIDTRKNQEYDFKELTKRMHGMGALVDAPHPMGISIAFGIGLIGGIGEKRLQDIIEHAREDEKPDVIEIFNAQSLCFFPLIANAAVYNRRAQAFAERYKLAGIAVPDSHNYRDLARSYFRMPRDMIDASSGEAFINGLKKAIQKTKEPGKYEEMNYMEYEPWFEFFKWAFWTSYSTHCMATAAIGAAAVGGVYSVQKLRERRSSIVEQQRTGVEQQPKENR